MRSLLSLMGCLVAVAGCCEPTCVKVGDSVTLTRFVDCPTGNGCDYVYNVTGGSGSQNNYVQWSASDTHVDGLGAFVDFELTGTNPVDQIWIEKTLIGCNPQTSTRPCTTAVECVRVDGTCQ